MTATTAKPGTGRPDERPGTRDEQFDQDALPSPPGATAALLRSLLAPMKARVALTTLLLLLQQAAVQAGRCWWRTPSTRRCPRSGATTWGR